MADPVGVQELANRLGGSRKTIWVWRDQGIMPAPDYPSINSGPAWEWRKVLKWCGDTGRLHNEDARAAFTAMFGKEPRKFRRGGRVPEDIEKIQNKARAGA